MPPKKRNPDGSPRTTKARPKTTRWWFDVPKGEDVAAALYAYFEDLKNRQGRRLQADLENLRLYGAPSTGPFTSGTYGGWNGLASNWSAAGAAQRVTISLAQACIDTLKSKLSTDKPRPAFITSGGDYAAINLAEQLQAFTDGVFYEMAAYAVALMAFIDAAIFGTGYIFVFETDDGRIGCERVFPYEIFADDTDALYGKPRNLYRVKFIDRGQMKVLYPDFADAIEMAAGMPLSDGALAGSKTNLVQVVEAWHLPSGSETGDGRHVLSVSTATLVDEEYDEQEFPFAILRYNEQEVGFQGQGLCTVIAPLQNELNTLLRKIQMCMHFLAVPHWLKPTSSNIAFGAFNNQIGSVINHSGVKPELMVPNSVPTEIFQHIDWLYNKGFEMAGVSQMEAQSKVPGYGTMSGAAVREVRDTAADRFKALSEAWGNFHVALAERCISLAQRIATRDEKYEVTFVRRSQTTGRAEGLDQIDWKTLKVDKAKFHIIIEPVSKFATDIPGSMQTAQEFVQAGLMDADTFKDLYVYPDLKADLDLAGAARKLVRKQVFAIMSRGDYFAPDPYMDLAYAVKYGTLTMNLAMVEGIAEEKTELLRTWVSACDDLMQAAQTAQAPAPAAMGAAAGQQPPPQPLAPAAQPGQVMQ